MTVGRADPASRFRDNVFPSNEHSSTLPARAVIAGVARKGVTHDKIIARNMREATEVYGVVESFVTGLETLVATSGNGESVTGGNRLRHGLPKLDRNGPFFAMAFYFHAK